jgi:hypothetical protein
MVIIVVKKHARNKIFEYVTRFRESEFRDRMGVPESGWPKVSGEIVYHELISEN